MLQLVSHKINISMLSDQDEVLFMANIKHGWDIREYSEREEKGNLELAGR